MTTATPFNFNPEENEGDKAWDIPYHTGCGLPVELCNCVDAPVSADGDRFIINNGTGDPPIVRIGPGETLTINLDYEGAEDEAREILASGFRPRIITLETSEPECAACGCTYMLMLDCKVGWKGRPVGTVKCPKCNHNIELSIDLVSIIQRVFDGKF